MTRSDVSALVLLVVAAGALFVGRVELRAMTLGQGKQQAHAIVGLGLAIRAAACLCTAAVLFARGGRSK